MTDKEPTVAQQRFARFFLEFSQKVLRDTVELITTSKQEFEADGETFEDDLIHFMLGLAAETVSRKLTESLYAERITLDQAEFLKNQLNSYYQLLIKENIEND